MKRGILFLVVLLGFFACKQGEKQSKSKGAVAETIEVPRPEVKLYAFDGGTVVVNTLEIFAQDETYKGQSKEFADAFYVVEHPKGNLIWDAGLPETLVGLPEPFTTPDGAFTVSRKDSVADQLKKIGLSPSDFKYISLSHTHFDHSGTANNFKEATWLVQETEYDFVTSKEVKENNPDVYNAIKELTNIKKLNGDFDVFGDGTVVLKYMPGHTPGHQVLYLDLEDHGPLLLAGDLYHFNENRTSKRIPIFNHDIGQTRASMDAFEAFVEEKNAKVYLQHSKEDFNRLPKAPNYLK
ncbi:MAG: N-acyl homoserine lactonase family protein [Saonia sp.]